MSSKGLLRRFLIAFFSLPVVTALAPAQSPPPEQADSILILKKAHRMELFSKGKVIRTYQVALGTGGLAPKQREGDARTPEGHYVIDSRNAASAYHKALHISYPNADDRRRAARLGASPGGAVMIHGLPNGKGFIGAAPPDVRLDPGLHRRDRPGNRRDLEAGARRHSRRNSALTEVKPANVYLVLPQ